MTKKDFAIKLLNMFFIVTTLITIVMGVMGLIVIDYLPMKSCFHL